jgi:hypothetical protein
MGAMVAGDPESLSSCLRALTTAAEERGDGLGLPVVRRGAAELLRSRGHELGPVALGHLAAALASARKLGGGGAGAGEGGGGGGAAPAPEAILCELVTRRALAFSPQGLERAVGAFAEAFPPAAGRRGEPAVGLRALVASLVLARGFVAAPHAPPPPQPVLSPEAEAAAGHRDTGGGWGARRRAAALRGERAQRAAAGELTGVRPGASSAAADEALALEGGDGALAAAAPDGALAPASPVFNDGYRQLMRQHRERLRSERSRQLEQRRRQERAAAAPQMHTPEVAARTVLHLARLGHSNAAFYAAAAAQAAGAAAKGQLGPRAAATLLLALATAVEGCGLRAVAPGDVAALAGCAAGGAGGIEGLGLSAAEAGQLAEALGAAGGALGEGHALVRLLRGAWA